MTPLDALYRCQRAWEQSQPQLFMELWPDVGLDEREACRPPLVEPAVSPHTPPGGGLTAGAEPRRDLLGTDGKSFLLTAAPAHGKTEPPKGGANGSAAGASAPLLADGMDEPVVTGSVPPVGVPALDEVGATRGLYLSSPRRRPVCQPRSATTTPPAADPGRFSAAGGRR